MKKIYLAGGCFWGLEHLMKKQIGVLNTDVGYCGGTNENPTYENHPGHAETLEITFDTNKTTYKKLLDYFFRIHDPSTPNQQGNDIGTSYRSAIFFQSDEERKDASEVIDLVNKSKLYAEPVATSLEKFVKFYKAEEYHQDYLEKNPGGYSCHFLRDEKSILN